MGASGPSSKEGKSKLSGAASNDALRTGLRNSQTVKNPTRLWRDAPLWAVAPRADVPRTETAKVVLNELRNVAPTAEYVLHMSPTVTTDAPQERASKEKRAELESKYLTILL